MAANEDIWVTLQKLSNGFPENGEQVKAALLEYYQSIKRSNAEMQKTADDFFESVGANERVKLLAMVVYGDIHNYIPGADKIYRNTNLSKKILSSLRKTNGEDRVGDVIQIFMIALAGDNNSALNEMKNEFEQGSDKTEDGRFEQFRRAMKNLFLTILLFNNSDSDKIIAAFMPLFYPGRNPEEYTSVVLSESQRIEGKPSKSQQNTKYDSKTIIDNIIEKIQDKINETEDRDFRRILVALKNDIFQIHHDAPGQPGLSDFFKVYEKLLESEKDFSKDLKSCLQEYDRYTRMKDAATFSLTAFKNLSIFSIKEDKAKESLEEKDKESIMQKLNKIQELISCNVENKIIEASIIDEVQNLKVAIEQAYRALDLVEATLDDAEQNWKKITENLLNIMGIANRECKKASENYGLSQQLFSLESGRNSPRQEIYEAIRTEAEGLLEVVSQVHLSISKAAYEQHKINQDISASCGGKK